MTSDQSKLGSRVEFEVAAYAVECRAAYVAEFGDAPTRDGAGDWDSTAWESRGGDLRDLSGEEYEAAWGAFQTVFFGEQKLTASQRDLLADLRPVLADGPKNTHQIAEALGDRTAYETYLRDRVYRLERAGLVVSRERLSPNGTCLERLWSLAV